ncbi:MAG TPA: hypothetical protein VJS68_01835, partial [Thermoplasmata archaeon]|nr:hypothetical protein [Thermoplasmata archaeon]
VKEPIVGTPPNLRAPIFEFFSTILREGISVDLVLGNHDVGLVRHLPREVRVHPAEGLSRYGVGMFHGHRWPGEHLRGARTLLAGHLHPGVRLAATGSGEGGKRPCWVRVRFPRQVRKNPARGSGGGYAAQELVVLPPFNPIAGTEALNRERPSRGRSFLYREFLCRGRRRAYLLDGTDLGDVLMTGPSPRPPAGGSARPGR